MFNRDVQTGRAGDGRSASNDMALQRAKYRALSCCCLVVIAVEPYRESILWERLSLSYNKVARRRFRQFENVCSDV